MAFEVQIPTFVNPNLFWIIDVQQIKIELPAIENELINSKDKYEINPDLGQVVSVYQTGWKRAVFVKQLPNNLLSCWLLDYGRLCKVSKVYNLPEHIHNKRKPLAKRASLHKIAPIKFALTEMLEKCFIPSSNYDVKCLNKCHAWIKEADCKYFLIEQKIDGIICGNLTLTKNHIFNSLADKLIQEEYAVDNDFNLFQQALSIEHPDYPLEFLRHLSEFECPILHDIYQSESFHTDLRKPLNDYLGENEKLQKDLFQELNHPHYNNDNARRIHENQETTSTSNEEEYVDCTELEEAAAASTNTNTTRKIVVQHSEESLKNLELMASIVKKRLKKAKDAKSQENKQQKEQNGEEVAVDFLNGSNDNGNCSINDDDSISSSNSTESKSKASSNCNNAKRGLKQVIEALSRNKEAFSSLTSNEGVRNKSESGSEASFKCEGSSSSVISNEETEEKTSNLSEGSEDFTDPFSTTNKQPHLFNSNCKCWACKSNHTETDKLQFVEKLEKVKENANKSGVAKKQPPLLFKTASSNVDNSAGIKETIFFNTILAHGRLFPTPFEKLLDASFCPQVKKFLDEHRIKEWKSMQACVMPALMAKRNVFIISGKESGKTSSYSLTICNWLIQNADYYKKLKDVNQGEKGPFAIILCSGVLEIQSLFKITDCFKLKKQTLLPPIKKNMKIKDEIEILITTPSILLTVIREKIVNLKRLCHLFVDSCDKTLDSNYEDIMTILQIANDVLKFRTYFFPIQIAMCGEHWNMKMEHLLNNLSAPPIVYIANPLEAALYGRVNFQPHFLESDKKLDTLKSILDEKYMLYQTLIVCNDDQETEDIKNLLEIVGMPFVVAKNDTNIEQLYEVKAKWENTVSGNRIIMVCTQDVLLTNLMTINSVSLLIHYSLPIQSWTAFKRRFFCLLNNLRSPLRKQEKYALQSRVHFFIDETCKEQLPRVLNFIQRFTETDTEKIPTKFHQLKQAFIENEEDHKIRNKVELCSFFKCFGECKKVSCNYRHKINKEVDVNPLLPKEGVIHFNICHVHNVTEYSIKKVNGGEEERLQALNDILARVREFADEIIVGEIYAYGISVEKFERVKILSVIGDLDRITKKPKRVKASFMDCGYEKAINPADLFIIPDGQGFKEIPPQAFKAHLINLKPPENDLSYSSRAIHIFKQILVDYNYDNSTSSFSADIVLQLGNDLFIDNLRLNESLDQVNINVTKLNVKKEILDQQLAYFDQEQKAIQKLIGLCQEEGIYVPKQQKFETTRSSLSNSSSSTITNKAIPYSAFLSEEYTCVYLKHVINPHNFFVSIQKFDSLLETLIADMQVALKSPLYPKLVLEDIKPGVYCLAKYFISNEYLRAVVQLLIDDCGRKQAECFFVDIGNTGIVDLEEIKFLHDDFITRLPFQAIRCKLFGVCSEDNSEWSEESCEFLSQFQFEPNVHNYFRELYVKAIEENKLESKYAVLLVDTYEKITFVNQEFIVENKKLKTQAVLGEELNPKEIEFLQPYLPENENDNESEQLEDELQESDKDERKEYTEYLENLEEGISSEISNYQRLNNGDLEERLANEDNWEMCGNLLDDCQETIAQQESAKALISRDTLPLPALTEAGGGRTGGGERGEAEGGNSSTLTTAGEFSSSLTSVSNKKLFPKLIWKQSNEQIHLTIYLQCNLPKILIIRNLIFKFEATYDHKEYEINLRLFGRVKNQFTFNCGHVIRITLTKDKPGNWDKLYLNNQKLKNISYDFGNEEDDEENDDKKKKKRLFLEIEKPSKEFTKTDKDEFIEEFYSDEDYDISDIESVSSD